MSVALVLGGGGAIGAALCTRLAAAGADVVVAGRTKDRLDEVAAQIGGVSVQVDATDASEVDRAADLAIERFGGLDMVANCVGSILLRPAHRTDPHAFLDVIRTNLFSAFWTVRSATKRMMKRGGSIALVTSAAAEIGLANHEAIASAKAGVAGLVRSAAATYGPRGIRVNAVSPGLVRSQLTRSITDSPAAEQASLRMHALRRLGDPDDVAAALAFLLDPAHDWITGQVLGVDGGLGSTKRPT